MWTVADYAEVFFLLFVGKLFALCQRVDQLPACESLKRNSAAGGGK